MLQTRQSCQRILPVKGSSFAKDLLEVMSIPISYKDRSFYFGVSKKPEALRLWDSGEIPMYLGKKGFVTRTYLSQNLEKAFEFAEIGYMRRTPNAYIKSNGFFGYIFVVESSEIVDIFPNESDIGRFVQKTYDKQYSNVDLDAKSFEFLRWVWSILSRDEQKSLIYNEKDAYHIIGRKILNLMSDSLMLWLLEKPDFGITNEGKTSFSTLYRVDRRETQVFKSEIDFLSDCTKVSVREEIV